LTLSSTIKTLLLVIALLVPSLAESAGLELVVPVWSEHVMYDDDAKEYSEGFDNRGIGFNLNLEDRIDLGFVVMTKDSVEEQSVYAYVLGYTDTTIQFGGGFTFVVKSKQDPQQREYEKTQPAMVIPVFAIKYGWVRVATTYPFGKLGAPMDLINVQLLIPLN